MWYPFSCGTGWEANDRKMFRKGRVGKNTLPKHFLKYPGVWGGAPLINLYAP